jgi:hypothetical protein
MFSNLSSSFLFGDGYTVFGDKGCAKRLVKHYVSSFGPKVTVTASVRIFTPRRIASRASYKL